MKFYVAYYVNGKMERTIVKGKDVNKVAKKFAQYTFVAINDENGNPIYMRQGIMD